MVLDDLQGLWQDNDGNVIEVAGDVAQWHTSSDSPVPVYVTSAGISVKGLQLVCPPDSPVWKFPDGTYHPWRRPLKTEWEEIFRKHKDELLGLRQQMWAAIKMEDLETAASLKDVLHAGGAVFQNCTQEQQHRLCAGRALTTGVCFVHKEWNHRGVIIACEPWRDASAASSPCNQDGPPGYYCLINERNAARGQLLFFREDEIMATEMAFPLQNSELENLLVPCPEISGYLPRPKLEQALQRQHSCRRFNWSTLGSHE